MSDPATHDDLDIELELISSSLLPAESLSSSDPGTWPRVIDITSDDSELSLHISVNEGYRSKDAVQIEIKSGSMGREEGLDRKRWVEEKMEEWNEEEDYPLYQILTTHFLPLLAPSPTPPISSSSFNKPTIPTTDKSTKPHHCLLISHHLLSNTKRKDLISLSSELSLVGFSKTGHPGIMYAIGQLEDLEEWVREVKSWNWLALRVRVAPERIPQEEEEGKFGKEGKGKENGARGGKGRGEWVELEKIGEALDWLRKRGEGREKILVDCGVGG
ncbi:hypothetical protein I302_106667 [Kwoniella bestiolae CBS 10118]|uniref:Uncharacterized protein n=1 Tax=Kwoniella bestiolae CBS 10118 TaxID=1296100 RepID=A0A1B9G0R8_9TREE|nr:hypothetical protein I302_06071 [Kwoniella bestiolae CBS 10118]OCF24610.1 hypothetical protein I302_06071 [Kwoniella bestiolae CBS 10118]